MTCGAIETPILLLKSGIGDKKILKQAGIKCIHRNNSIGKNLQDHWAKTFWFQTKIDFNSLLVNKFACEISTLRNKNLSLSIHDIGFALETCIDNNPGKLSIVLIKKILS